MNAQPPEDSGAKSNADPAGTATPSEDVLLRSAFAAMTTNLAVLTHDLDEAAQSSFETKALNGGREGCMMALRAVVEFCDRAGLGPGRRRPLLQIYLALESLENGVIDPLFKNKFLAGAPPLTGAERWQRGCLAAAMEALIRGGFKPDDAARWVARRSRNMMTAGRVQTELWKAVKKWRATAKIGDRTQDRDALAFWTACEVLGQGIAVGQQGAEILIQLAAAEA